ncbi:hypothetical protein GGR56DRAFT_491038 [Xylariaceae sp. FL0804]|nr:hypothetical protein GGR56DRAFT_491038 [Xylariaceae sp. FL0804]
MADTDDAVHAIATEEQLWSELEAAVSTQCGDEEYEVIDDALRTWLQLAARCRDDFARSGDDVAACAHLLLGGRLFAANADYVRTQITYSLLQEEETGPLYAIATLLLLDGRATAANATFARMVGESCFARLLELIHGRRELDPDLHRLLLELLYEMSRIEQLRPDDLLHVDDGFVRYLFQLIEQLSDDVHDPYHYPVIRVLLVLNEQYMVASATAASDASSGGPLTNRVVKCLSQHGDHYRTFGENLILLLNRETETSLQLLILKLLYLLFTTKATYEYFYTNDLRVLLDVIIRNLLDLPDELVSLRHTYLRVLYPLLAHTQLSQPPHYKRDEVHKVLRILAGSGHGHFAPADETTLRLVDRVGKVRWLAEASATATAAAADEGPGASSSSSSGPGAGEIARKLLGISLSPADAASNTSVVDVAAVSEKPGVQTPSRKAEAERGGGGASSDDHHHQARRGEAGEGERGEGPEGGGGQATTSTSNGVWSSGGPPVPNRAKKPLPQVPRHRHGTLYAVPAAAAPSDSALLLPGDGDGHSNGNGNGSSNGSSAPAAAAAKRLPPKAPPPRRKGRLKAVVVAGSEEPPQPVS